jgi:hypothetical protein
MERVEDPPHGGGENHEDQDLSAELESLYRHVVQYNKPDASGERNADAGGDGKAVDDLMRNRDLHRNPPNQNELMEQLTVITEAYEKILTYWPYRPERRQQTVQTEATSKIASDTAIRDDRAEGT